MHPIRLYGWPQPYPLQGLTTVKTFGSWRVTRQYKNHPRGDTSQLRAQDQPIVQTDCLSQLFRPTGVAAKATERLELVSRRKRSLGMARPVVHLLRLRQCPIYEQLQIEEALLRSTKQNWFVLNDGANTAAVVMGVSG